MNKTRSKIRKTSKQPISKLQSKVWELCKQIIRKKYVHDCYTCEAKNLSGRNLHTGHMIPKSICKVRVKYDIRNLRPQCMACNNHRGGMGAEFHRRMIIREGQEYVDAIYNDQALPNFFGKGAYDYYEMLLEKYKIILEEL